MHRAIWLLSVYRFIGLSGYWVVGLKDLSFHRFLYFVDRFICFLCFIRLSVYRFIGLLGYWFVSLSLDLAVAIIGLSDCYVHRSVYRVLGVLVHRVVYSVVARPVQPAPINRLIGASGHRIVWFIGLSVYRCIHAVMIGVYQYWHCLVTCIFRETNKASPKNRKLEK